MSVSRRDLLKAAAWMAALATPIGCGSAAGGGPAPVAPPQPQSPPPAPESAPVAETKKEKSILILGGTGFLGPHLVEDALRRGHKVTLFNRGKTNADLFPDLEKLRGNRDGDLKALEGRKWDAVIDTSGYVPRIVKASAELLAPSVEHYIFISSISVYKTPGKPGTDENGPLATVEDETTEEVRKHYGALKALCEKAAEKAMPGRVSNIRPGLIVGPRDPSDRFTYWPVRVAKGGEVLCPGSGDDPVQFIDARDLAAWIITTIEEKHMGVYNAVGPDARMSMRELVEACKKASSSDASFVWAPVDFLEKQEIKPWSDMPVWVPASDPEDGGLAEMSFAKAKAKGLVFRPVDETIRDTLSWWGTLPEERRAKMRAGLDAEREAKALTALKKAKKKLAFSYPRRARLARSARYFHGPAWLG